METTCAIVLSSIIGGICITMAGCLCYYKNKPNNNVPYIIETITITKEHYDTLKNYMTNKDTHENSILPEYVDTLESPPDYINQ